MADYQLSYTGDQVNTAIGQIVNKNITGTLNIETLSLTNPLTITQGGTGKDNRADAFYNLVDYEFANVLNSDTPESWGRAGSGVHSFQDSTGGGSVGNSTIQNWVFCRLIGGSFSPSTVTQLKITNAGQCYTRFSSVSSSNWDEPWTQLLTTKNGIQIVKLWENASPTSAFANQTLTLDFSSYDLMVILFNLDSNNRSVSLAIVPIGHPGASSFQNNVRTFLSYTDSVKFDSVSPSSAVMIPYVIYGIKGVI